MNNTVNTSRRARRAFSARTTLAAALIALACAGCALDQPLAGLGNIFGAPAEAKTAQNSKLEAVQRKVAEGADAKALREELSSVLEDYSCGKEATGMDRLEAVRFLLDNGVGVNQKNEGNQTPLQESLERLSYAHWACFLNEVDGGEIKKEEHSKIAMLLVSRGANMNISVTSAGSGQTARSQIYRTALGTAVECGMSDLVQMMIEKGAKVNAADKWGQTPLQVAQEALNGAETEAQKNEYRKIISMLKSAGAGSKGKKNAKKRK